MDTYVGKFQKKAILICAMVILIGFLIGYFNYKGNEIIYTGDDEAEVLSQDTITKINIGIIPDTGDLDDYEIFDKEDIGTVVDFLNSIIHTTKIENHQDDSYGMTELYNEDAHIKDSNGFNVLSRKRMCILDTDNKEIDISYCYMFDFKKNEVFSGPEKGDQVEIQRGLSCLAKPNKY